MPLMTISYFTLTQLTIYGSQILILVSTISETQGILAVCSASNYPNITDFAKALRVPKFMVPPASLRVYRNSTARYATQ